MCRILGYLGPQISLDQLMLKPAHSMLVQSYQPRELKNAVLNGDGFGFGWHSQDDKSNPFVYRNTLPMWNDRSLTDLCRYIQAESFVVNLRSATAKMPLDLSNCQPFTHKNVLFVHNGFIENFFESLYRPMREMICDTAYRSIQGLTDSEHIFALLIHYLETQPGIDLAEALHQTIQQLSKMAKEKGVHLVANIILSTSDRLIALRFDNQQKAPSFYLLTESSHFPNAVILTSEPLFEANWQTYSQNEIISITRDQPIKTYATVG